MAWAFSISSIFHESGKFFRKIYNDSLVFFAYLCSVIISIREIRVILLVAMLCKSAKAIT